MLSHGLYNCLIGKFKIKNLCLIAVYSNSYFSGLNSSFLKFYKCLKYLQTGRTSHSDGFIFEYNDTGRNI